MEVCNQISFLDFKKGEVRELYVNNENYTERISEVYSEGKISLDSLNIMQGEMNNVTVRFSAKYSLDGYGLTKTRNGRFYFLNTQSQPSSASRIFPCFDFPGVKNNLKLYLTSWPEFEYSSNGDIVRKLTDEELNKIEEEEGEPIRRSLALDPDIPLGMAEVEFAHAYDLNIQDFAFACGHYVKQGGQLRIQNKLVMV